MQTLAFAGEVGSGKSIVPVLGSLIKRGEKCVAFLAAGVIPLVEEFPELASSGSVRSISGKESVQDAVSSFLPDVILVGTTAVDGLERQLVVYGREHEIRTVALVDERYGYRRRFSDHAGNLRYLPDVVAVMDEECYANAEAEGLPPTKLRVTGSPILSHLVFHYRHSGEDSCTSSYRPDSSWKQVTFVSETFARDNGSSPCERGRLGSFLGFTEEGVRRDILASLREIGTPTVLVEQLHPSDLRSPEEGWIGDGLFWKQVNGGILWRSMVCSDAVVGMRSMALLEAALLGCRVASYQPNLIGKNNCAAVRYGLAARLETPRQLKGWLEKNLSTETPRMAPPTDLPFIRVDAAERVAELVLGAPGDR